jgi:hypothetical protein
LTLFAGPNSLFIRILLDKKYALPFKVVDAIVYHFMRFKSESRELPVLWHQAFLVFAQRCVSTTLEGFAIDRVTDTNPTLLKIKEMP